MTKSIALCVVLAVGIQAQPAFEVASVKPHLPGPGPFRVTNSAENGRVDYVNMNLNGIIRNAYGIAAYQIAGGPAWFSSERFDITAKATGRATKEQMMPMLQALLAERFRLVAHRELRDLAVYFLVVAKDGLRIHEVKDDGGGAEFDGDDEHPITAKNISMARLAGILTQGQQAGRPVFDQTGLKGVFNFSLRFAPDDATGEVPDIFSALQEQLGLKLVPGRTPAEVLVIDHAERPAAN